MIIIMQSNSTDEDLQKVVNRIKELGYDDILLKGTKRKVIAAIGDARGKFQLQSIDSMRGVEKVVPILKTYKLVGKEAKPQKTVIKVGDVEIGGDKIVVMAGPCSIETPEIALEIGRAVKKAGATIFRGGAFKPRSSPYAFQGLGEEGLKIMDQVRRETGLLLVTEVLETPDIELIAKYTDIFQVGARNMQNFALLKALGKIDKPVLLKRGMMSTIDEWLNSAEYILSEGNGKVIMCERGIRTFETATRNTLDLSAVPIIKKSSHLPIIVDPSHGVGKWSLVNTMSRGAIAVGADGLMIEVHPNPADAYSDGSQSLVFNKFEQLMKDIVPFVQAAGRKI
ncbi:MAG: 3-deoxy-7-phosphoheptulonate synthase [Elusimicrobia bacterium RIFOXYA2_FULL_40_6]|nr:MAG: 3-deoxy-7-phosphoheptulonate synthase [Elusimicrobia bacterium RIFOXYA2_FULL_40_6]